MLLLRSAGKLSLAAPIDPCWSLVATYPELDAYGIVSDRVAADGVPGSGSKHVDSSLAVLYTIDIVISDSAVLTDVDLNATSTVTPSRCLFPDIVYGIPVNGITRCSRVRP